jgi:MSHA biogenesis protein MshN
MSVINQMLLDLEARAKSEAGNAPEQAPEAAMQSEVRAAQAPKLPFNRLPWLFGALAVTGVLAVAWTGWQHWQEQKSRELDLPPQLTLRISDALLPMPELNEQTLAEAAASGAAAADPTAATPTPGATGTTGPTGPTAAGALGAAQPLISNLPPVSPPATYAPAKAAPYPGAAPAPGNYPPAVPAPGHYPPAVPAAKTPLALDAMPPAKAHEAGRAEPREPAAAAAELTPRQQAEAETRRGQDMQRSGRSTEAIAAYERALQMDRGYAPARQSLAAVLAENKRVDEAMTRLQEGLDENRANGTLAMMLARLQLDRGETRAAIDTLGRSLPYDRERPDYQAFMAGLLQKEGRHQEAIDYYLTALRRTPKNGAWWMGLGLSLQAEKRVGEAREAYQRALAVGGLSSVLQSFVQQRLEQMR